MRISDWSSDVCSSDLQPGHRKLAPGSKWLWRNQADRDQQDQGRACRQSPRRVQRHARGTRKAEERKSAVQGKRVSVRVDQGGGGRDKNKKSEYSRVRQ